MKYTEDELNELCEKAIVAINKRYHLHLIFKGSWWFENSAGSRLHMTYDNADGLHGYDFNQNGNIVTKETELTIDRIAGIKTFFPQETKIILRIAYHIYLQLKHAKVI